MEFGEEYGFCKAYLAEDEKVLWTGKPGKGNLIHWEDFVALPVSIAWCAFAIKYMIGSIQARSFFSVVLESSFLLVGLYLLCGRILHMVWLRKRTRYVITDRKIIRLRHKRVDTLQIRGMPLMRVTYYKDGNGTIRINKWIPERNYYYPTPRRGVTIPGLDAGEFVLENIPVWQVEDILNRLST